MGKELLFRLVWLLGVCTALLAAGTVAWFVCAWLHLEFWRTYGPIGLASNGTLVASLVLLAGYAGWRLVRRGRGDETTAR